MFDVLVGTICTIISSCTVVYFTYYKDKQKK